MSSDSSNGGTLTFNATPITKITKMSFKKGAKEIDVTDLASTFDKFLAGTLALVLEVTINGTSSVAIGGTGGTFSYVHNDGTTQTGSPATTFICLQNDVDDTLNQPITSTLSFKPYGG